MTKHTPHPVLDKARLAQVHDATLRRLIELRRAAVVPNARLRDAGVPPLESLEAERRRRKWSAMAIAS